jgi:pimeloyl-ACP methyl ester carboxylesterase
MRCKLRGLSIHYLSRGSGRPFLMLHGSPGDGQRAQRQLEPAFRSRRGWQRFYPDLPGHGKTPGSPGIRDIDEYLDVLVDLVDELFSKRKVALGGYSFGAYLALGIARKRPRSIAGLMLSCPEVNFSPLEERREAAAGVPPIRPPGDRSWDDYTEDTTWLQGLPWRDLSFDLYRSVKPVRAPALFLFGRKDAAFRYQKYAKLIPDFPNASFAILAGGGHRLWDDQRELANALVGDWLDRMATADPSRTTG